MKDYTPLITHLREDWAGHREEAAEAIEELSMLLKAALYDLGEYASCDYCKHANPKCEEYWNIGEMGLHGLCNGEGFEWRGLTKENMTEEVSGCQVVIPVVPKKPNFANHDGSHDYD